MVPNTFMQWLTEQMVPLAIIAGVLAVGVGILWVSARSRREEANDERAGKNVDSFVEGLAAFNFDPKIARTTYEYLIQMEGIDFPIFPEDTLREDLGISDEEKEQAIEFLLAENGRASRLGIQNQPVITVADLVRFVQASPRVMYRAA